MTRLLQLVWMGSASLLAWGCADNSAAGPSGEMVANGGEVAGSVAGSSGNLAGGGKSGNDGGSGARNLADGSAEAETGANGGPIGPDGSPSDYNPCPAKGAPCVVMPLGDSITYGDGSTNHAGYRTPLFHLALTSRQSVTFVGGMMDGPDTVDGVPFPRHHEGHSGYEIDGVAGFAAQALSSTHPQIVLLMLGTNDIAFGFEVPNAPARLGKLMDIVTGTDRNLLLIVAQIVPSMDDPTNLQIQTLNAAIPGLVKARANAGAHIRMVDMYGALTSSPSYKTDYLFNKYHPNDAGYVKMAETWYAVLGPLLR